MVDQYRLDQRGMSGSASLIATWLKPQLKQSAIVSGCDAVERAEAGLTSVSCWSQRIAG
jgi:hypothetical protein